MWLAGDINPNLGSVPRACATPALRPLHWSWQIVWPSSGFQTQARPHLLCYVKTRNTDGDRHCTPRLIMAKSKAATGKKKAKRAKSAPKIKYDCLKCPGYCCSYPVIQVSKYDITRIARHFDMPVAKAEKKFCKSAHGYKRILRHQHDEVYDTICRFFDRDKRRCTIYKARPSTCREFPGDKHCGYYDFLAFERETQDDEDHIATTDHRDV